MYLRRRNVTHKRMKLEDLLLMEYKQKINPCLNNLYCFFAQKIRLFKWLKFKISVFLRILFHALKNVKRTEMCLFNSSKNLETKMVLYVLVKLVKVPFTFMKRFVMKMNLKDLR